MSKLSQIEQKIKDVCPWLMELTFGCEVKIVRNSIFADEMLRRYGERTWTVTKDGFSLNTENGGVCMKMQELFAHKDSFEILGKEPQLSDLLYTIGKSDNGFTVKVDEFGDFRKDVNDEYLGNYDLTKSVRENLENKELCDFIHQLICK